MVGSFTSKGWPAPARHPPARLADEQRAGRDVPRVGLPLPVGVEPAGGDVREREAGAEHRDAPHLGPEAGHALAHARVPPEAGLVPERDDAAAPSCPCATPGSGGRSARRLDHARRRTAPAAAGTASHRPRAGPAARARSTRRTRAGPPRTRWCRRAGPRSSGRRAGRDRAALLAQEPDGREPPVEEPPDDPLRRAVRARDGIPRALRAGPAPPGRIPGRGSGPPRGRPRSRRGSPGRASCDEGPLDGVEDPVQERHVAPGLLRRRRSGGRRSGRTRRSGGAPP